MLPPFDIAIAAVVLAPIAIGLVAPLLQRLVGWWAGVLLAVIPAAIAWYLLRLVPEVAGGGVLRAEIAWVPSIGIALPFLVDTLSLTFALAIAGIGALILLYAASYLRGHSHQGRFMATMLVFMGAMLGLVLADGWVPLYAFWELTTVTSFLLIGFDHARRDARRAAMQSLVVTNIGGLGLLAAGVIVHWTTGSWSLSAATGSGTLVFILILVAAFTKSAQVPFHFWLPGAMQAPTPVSAFLHSATMVQGGVYLLARLHPGLGDHPAWLWTLAIAGSVTLLWGGLVALRQTDLKLMLAQTTVASLGLLVLLIGIGATEAALIYFVAHALYKAALFLVVGVIDHATGVRDMTALSGLRERMPVTFVAALLSALSMIGLPPALGFFAKELGYGTGAALPLLAVLVAGNAAMIAVALAVSLRPFLGRTQPTPHEPHDGDVALLLGPVALGILGAAAPWLQGLFGIDAHLEFHFWGLPIMLSAITWALGIIVFLRLDRIRISLAAMEERYRLGFDRGFDWLFFGLVRGAGLVTRIAHHGRLELYLVVAFAMFALATCVPLLLGGLPRTVALPELTFYEWGMLALAAAGVVTVLVARTRLLAILALGIQGFAVAMLFLLFGAPDLSFTQFMVEVLSVVILALVMTRLRLEREDPREFEDWLRDGTVALFCGLGIVGLLLTILSSPFDPRLSEFFALHSVPAAHGHNIVNVILVDFRGLDTLGEAAVVMTAGVAILALIRGEPRRAAAEPQRRRRRRGRQEAAA